MENIFTVSLPNGKTQKGRAFECENAKKNLPEKRITNNYWIAAMKYNQIRGGDYDAEYEKAISNITADGIKAAVSEIIGAGNFRETVMLPQ